MLTGVPPRSEWISPIGMCFHRGSHLRCRPRLDRGPGVFLFDLFGARHGWCGHLCPLGVLRTCRARGAGASVRFDGMMRWAVPVELMRVSRRGILLPERMEATGSFGPARMLTTPAGTPASAHSSPTIRAETGGFGGRLDDDRAARGHRRADLEGEVQQRKIPRHVGDDNAQRLVNELVLVRALGVGGEFRRASA